MGSAQRLGVGWAWKVPRALTPAPHGLRFLGASSGPGSSSCSALHEPSMSVRRGAVEQALRGHGGFAQGGADKPA